MKKQETLSETKTGVVTRPPRIIEGKLFLQGGYILKFNYNEEDFGKVYEEHSQRMQTGQDLRIGYLDEFGISLWTLTDMGEAFMANLEDSVCVPSSKIILYSI